MSYPEYDGGLSRRTLIKSSAIGSLALAAGAVSLPFSRPPRAKNGWCGEPAR
jgi:Tat-targeted selenate reductase subunit YnfE